MPASALAVGGTEEGMTPVEAAEKSAVGWRFLLLLRDGHSLVTFSIRLCWLGSVVFAGVHRPSALRDTPDCVLKSL